VRVDIDGRDGHERASLTTSSWVFAVFPTRGAVHISDRAAELDAALDAPTTDADCGEDTFVMAREYQIVVARRRR
jgi:hypothetical protein